MANAKRGFRRQIATLLLAPLAWFGLAAPLWTTPAAQAAVTSQVVIHKPGTPRVVPASTVNVNGNAVSFIAGDAYGAFAIAQIPLADTSVTIGSYTWQLSKGREIWLDNAGSLYNSRAAAQGYQIVRFRVASGQAANATLDVYDQKLEYTHTALTPEAGSTATEAVFHIPVNAVVTRKIEVQPKLNGEISGATRIFDIKSFGEVWLSTAYPEVRGSESWADGYATFHYNRPDGEYGFSGNTCPVTSDPDVWGMHVWTGTTLENVVTWGAPLMCSSKDSFGLVFRVPLAEAATAVNFLFHLKDTKDPSNGGDAKDQVLDLAQTGGEVWFVSEESDDAGRAVYAVPVIASIDADLTLQKAIWALPNKIAYPETLTLAAHDAAGVHASLLYSSEGAIKVVENSDTGVMEVTGVENRWPLDLSGGASLGSAFTSANPYLASYRALTVPADAVTQIKTLLTGQLALLISDDSTGTEKIKRLTGIQLWGVLDNLYAAAAADAELGVVWDGGDPLISVWAPTAQDVNLIRYAGPTGAAAETLDMDYNSNTGVWSIRGGPGWRDSYYNFEVTVYAHSKAKVVTNVVTDPYSLSLSMNSTRTQIWDPSDTDYLPEGWATTARPAFTSIKDASIYELHIRDFSAIDTTVPEAERGTYLAFTETGSAGMQHLKALEAAGLTHIHLLPTFDIASVNEDKSTWEDPAGNLSAMAADSEDQQAAVGAVANRDGYNWGYDPYHFSAPEGSYAVVIDGGDRNLEFRQMVQSLHAAGLRVVMDVVYNHTNSSGQNDKSVFDKIVPGYYHRLNVDGTVATSTCCQNTATEHPMMAKFTRESLLSWVKNFGVDGFRFDLMGHMPKSLMQQIRADMNSLTLANDGIVGSSIILYGEGWDFGEVTGGKRFVQAIQKNMAGTGIAVFDDRLRDSGKGGGPFDSNPTIQGFATGGFVDWNQMPASGASALERQLKLFYNSDVVKLGLVGMLSKYSFKTADGFTGDGTTVLYNGKQAGYNLNPTDQIAYLAAHDGNTLFDLMAYKLPGTASRDTRVRNQVIGLAIPLLGQGVPFFVAGDDIMHSKSLDKNSYNSGDWFNAIDWSRTDNGFGKGLPPQGDNSSWWDIAKLRLGQSANIKPTTANMTAVNNRFREFLRVRYSSPLFRLGTGTEVSKRVRFLTTSGARPGLIPMQILDGTASVKTLKDLDKNWRSLVSAFNTNPKAQTFTFARDTAKCVLHPVLAKSSDATVKKATCVAATTKVKGKTVKIWKVTVPGRTVAVFGTK